MHYFQATASNAFPTCLLSLIVRFRSQDCLKAGPDLRGQRAGLRRRSARVQIAAATLSGNSLRQTVHTHRAAVHQAAKVVAALLMVARVTAGLEESNGSLPPGL